MGKITENIHLDQLPNGWSLTVGDKYYMYFSKETMSEGFLAHVGLGIHENLDLDTIHLIAENCIELSKEKDVMKAVIKLRQELDEMRMERDTARWNMNEQKDRISELHNELILAKRRLRYFLQEHKKQNSENDETVSGQDDDEGGEGTSLPADG